MMFIFCAVLSAAGSRLSLADGPSRRGLPVSSVVYGPNEVSRGSMQQFVFVVSFNDGGTLSFPPSAGATVTSVPAGAVNNLWVLTAPAAAGQIKINASYAQNGVTTSASKLIFVR